MYSVTKSKDTIIIIIIAKAFSIQADGRSTDLSSSSGDVKNQPLPALYWLFQFSSNTPDPILVLIFSQGWEILLWPFNFSPSGFFQPLHFRRGRLASEIRFPPSATSSISNRVHGNKSLRWCNVIYFLAPPSTHTPTPPQGSILLKNILLFCNLGCADAGN